VDGPEVGGAEQRACARTDDHGNGDPILTTYFNEGQVELATVDYFRQLGYEFAHGPEIAPDPPAEAPGAGRKERPTGASGAARSPNTPCVNGNFPV